MQGLGSSLSSLREVGASCPLLVAGVFSCVGAFVLCLRLVVVSPLVGARFVVTGSFLPFTSWVVPPHLPCLGPPPRSAAPHHGSYVRHAAGSVASSVHVSCWLFHALRLASYSRSSCRLPPLHELPTSYVCQSRFVCGMPAFRLLGLIAGRRCPWFT